MALSKFAKMENLDDFDSDIEVEMVLEGLDIHVNQVNQDVKCQNIIEFPLKKNDVSSKSDVKNPKENDRKFTTSKIPGLEKKIRDILLTDKRHPAKRLNSEYLWEKLEELVEKGLVRRHDCEDNEYHIYNYTHKPYKNTELWDYFTLIARGLVLRVDSEWYKKAPSEKPYYPDYVEVAAVTWPKFFNVYEDLNPMDIFETADKWEISNKVDGSLGIIFFNTFEQKWQCCTKGSFTSNQAKFANKILKNTKTDGMTPGNTYLVEIVCSDNDLIIEYDFEGLILLGAYTARGEEYTYDDLKYCLECVNIGDEKLFNLVDFLNFTTIEELEKYLNQTTRKEMIEGVVMKYYINNACHRFKWKTQTYLDFHWTRQKLSKKSIFQALSKSDEDVEEMRDKIAEEHHMKFDQIVKNYRSKVHLALVRAKTMLGIYYHAVENEGQEDSKAKLVEWLDKVLVSMENKSQKRDKSLILKAYSDGMDTFEKSWIQEKKPTNVNRDRKFLFNYVSVDKE